ncbi:multiple C2 and transmembrane domain-containing protein 1 isoform X2 [Lampetra fluviatilis]
MDGIPPDPAAPEAVTGMLGPPVAQPPSPEDLSGGLLASHGGGGGGGDCGTPKQSLTRRLLRSIKGRGRQAAQHFSSQRQPVARTRAQLEMEAAVAQRLSSSQPDVRFGAGYRSGSSSSASSESSGSPSSPRRGPPFAATTADAAGGPSPALPAPPLPKTWDECVGFALPVPAMLPADGRRSLPATPALRRPPCQKTSFSTSASPKHLASRSAMEQSHSGLGVRTEGVMAGPSGCTVELPGLPGLPIPPIQAGPSAPGSLYQLSLRLREGRNLVIRDRGGTSDPYVKFKLGGKMVYKSKIIYKNLNPVWNEPFVLLLDNLKERIHVKVFDHDIGIPDDFMGSAYLDLEYLTIGSTVEVRLKLEDDRSAEDDMGVIILDATLTHRELESRDNTLGVPRAMQSIRLSDIHRKAQLWSGIVSVTLIEGRQLRSIIDAGPVDPYVKFRLGAQKYKSKTIPKTSNPMWREQFEFHLYEDRATTLDICVWNKCTGFGRRDECIGRCQKELATLTKEQTHRLEVPLEEGEGSLLLLLTLTASSAVAITDLCASPLGDAGERRSVVQRYALRQSLSNVKDVGFLQVKVIRAEGLMAADVTGKSDPFCVVELGNDRLLTHTVYKTLNPEWNKVFTFNLKDIHSVLEVTVYDEDWDRTVDFLGKVAIPLLSVKNGEEKGLVLKNKHLTACTKGTLFVEMEVIYNPVKASIRTFLPKESKYMEEHPKLSKQLLLQNFNRVRRCVMAVVNAFHYINSCFNWDSPPRSVTAFILFLVSVWNFELYMLPLGLLLLFIYHYVMLGTGSPQEPCVVEDMVVDDDDDDERDDKDSERKGLMEKLHAFQEVCVSVQNLLGRFASLCESIKNTFNWTVPFLSWLAMAVLAVVTLVLYLVPLRFIVLLWGINKFTKKLRNPYQIDNNEVLDFLSRVPSDVQRVQYREIKHDLGPSPSRKKRSNPG